MLSWPLNRIVCTGRTHSVFSVTPEMRVVETTRRKEGRKKSPGGRDNNKMLY
jgi:hypothetical protein